MPGKYNDFSVQDPERAILGFIGTQKGWEKATTSNSVAQTVKNVQELLETYTPRLPSGEATPDAAVVRWGISSIYTSSYTVHTDKKPVIEASTMFSAKFRDLYISWGAASALSVMPNVGINSIKGT
ncbi:hypothetical protein EMCG_01538 [[Emmonsia] crescens]|uniref:Uncharacterized protein n=1 Tax=[Emmonsia] crescens TaxID=73230 RepID=A0A0G2I1Z9_9EURO|nr:hypothetical protein EMCG_01538 [Emmonsia crescens UAMH 3008]